MKRKSLPIGILALVLMLALGSLGVVYGAYTQNLTAVATVNTATFNVHWGSGMLVAPTDAASQTTCTIGGEGTRNLTLQMNNVLPGSGCAIVSSVVNDSSIPVKLSAVNQLIDNHGATWLQGAAGYGQPVYNLSQNGGSALGKNIVVFADNTLGVTTAQTATGSFTLVASE
jgi:hypothetical protein